MALGLTHYYTGKPCKWGHDSPKFTSDSQCVECSRERMRVKRATDAEYVERQRKAERERKRLKRATDVEFVKRERECARNYVRLNPEKKNALNAKRRARKQQATPAWLTTQQLDEIEEFYRIAAWLSKKTGEKYSVDHIVPLKGKAVCGLHVGWNLRVIRLAENTSKNNALDDDIAQPAAVVCVAPVAIFSIPMLIERQHELEQYLYPRPGLPGEPLH